MILTHGANSVGSGNKNLFKFPLLTDVPTYTGTAPTTIEFDNVLWSKIPNNYQYNLDLDFSGLSDTKIKRIKFEKYVYSFTGSGGTNLRLPWSYIYAFRVVSDMPNENYDNVFATFSSYDFDYSLVPAGKYFSSGSRVYVFGQEPKFNTRIICEYTKTSDGFLSIKEGGGASYKIGIGEWSQGKHLYCNNENNTNGYLIRNLEVEFE